MRSSFKEIFLFCIYMIDIIDMCLVKSKKQVDKQLYSSNYYEDSKRKKYER